MGVTTAILDTNVLIDLYRNRKAANETLLQLPVKNYCISAITYCEFLGGAHKRNKKDARKFLAEFIVVDINTTINNQAKQLCNTSELHKNHIADLLIAATAICNNYLLVTANVKHFSYKGIALHKYQASFFAW